MLREDDDPAALAREADTEVLGIAGGDGSLAPIAQVAIGRELPFVCIPFGTRNHFARDLGLDRGDPVGALEAFGGEELRIDVGRASPSATTHPSSIGARRTVAGAKRSRGCARSFECPVTLVCSGCGWMGSHLPRASSSWQTTRTN